MNQERDNDTAGNDEEYRFKRRDHPLFTRDPDTSAPILVPHLYVNPDTPSRSLWRIVGIVVVVSSLAFGMIWLLAVATAPDPIVEVVRNSEQESISSVQDNSSSPTDQESLLTDLEKNRRDAQRKADTSRLLAALELYAADNKDIYPAVDKLDQVVKSYIPKTGDNSRTFIDPSTALTYQFVEQIPALGEMRYINGSLCNDTPATQLDQTRHISVVVGLETGGTYCQDNQ